MRLVIQRVKQSKVEVGGKIVGEIGKGLLIFIGVEKEDSHRDIDYLIEKIIHLRIFEDSNGKMNLSAFEVSAEFLVVSQFTLLGDCQNGRRPSFDRAADPSTGELMYQRFVEQLKAQSVKKVATGQFRAMMDVSLVNDGPVTFVLESRLRQKTVDHRLETF